MIFAVRRRRRRRLFSVPHKNTGDPTDGQQETEEAKERDREIDDDCHGKGRREKGAKQSVI